MGVPVLLALAGLFMLGWSWDTWPDIVVDSGRELYVPWQILEGRALYRDLAYPHGPLSPHLNALWLRLLGVGVLQLALVNLALAALLLLLLWRLLRSVSGRVAATAAALVFVLLFAASQYVYMAGYNYLLPVHHELTHGLLLSVVLLHLLRRFELRRLPLSRLVVPGAVLGLLVLTRLEMSAPAALAAAGWLALGRTRPRGRGLGWLALGAAMPVALSFLWMCLAMPPVDALRGTLAGLWPLDGGRAARWFFLAQGAGFDRPGHGAWRLLLATGGYLAALLPAAALAMGLRRPTSWRVLAAVGAGLSMGGVLLGLEERIAWEDAARPLPLFLLLVLGACWGMRGPQPEGSAPEPRRPLLVALALWSGGLLLPMLLHARIYHLGFALAMPATLLLVVALLHWLPRAVERRGGHGLTLALAVLAALAVGASVYLHKTGQWYAHKRFYIHRGRDTVRSDHRGALIRWFIGRVEHRLQLKGTLAVLPEGVMLNYLLRLPNPTPYTELLPPALEGPRERQVIAAFARTPPDHIVLMHRDSAEYGPRFFGVQYGRELMAWVQARYRPVLSQGSPPFEDHQRFGLVLLSRVDEEAGPGVGPR